MLKKTALFSHDGFPYGDDDGADDAAGADYDADDFTAAPLGRTQRLVQTRTPRQDFFKMFTCNCNV